MFISWRFSYVCRMNEVYGDVMMSMSNICTCQQGFSMLTELTSHMWATFYKFLLIRKTCECHFLDLDKLCQIVVVTNLYLWPKWIQHILAGWLVDNLPDFNNLQYIINIWWWETCHNFGLILDLLRAASSSSSSSSSFCLVLHCPSCRTWSCTVFPDVWEPDWSLFGGRESRGEQGGAGGGKS